MVSRRDQVHKWTAFEKHTLFCLICRGLHLTGFQDEDEDVMFGRTLISTTAKRKRAMKNVKDSRHAYMDVATALNRALNNGSYANDIPVKDVTIMIDHIIHDRKGAMAYLERQPFCRITRTSNRVLRRGLSFTGDKKEWLAGRKKREEQLRLDNIYGIIQRENVQEGGQPIDDDWRKTGNPEVGAHGRQNTCDEWGDSGAAITSQARHSENKWGSSDASITQNEAPVNVNALLDEWADRQEAGASNKTLPLDDDWGGTFTVKTSFPAEGSNDWTTFEEDATTASLQAQAVDDECGKRETGSTKLGPNSQGNWSGGPAVTGRPYGLHSPLTDAWGSVAAQPTNAAPANNSESLRATLGGEERSNWTSDVDSWGTLALPSNVGPTASGLEDDWGGITQVSVAMERSNTNMIWGSTFSNTATTTVNSSWDNPLPSTEKATPTPTPGVTQNEWGAPPPEVSKSQCTASGGSQSQLQSQHQSSSPDDDMGGDHRVSYALSSMRRHERSTAPSPDLVEGAFTERGFGAPMMGTCGSSSDIAAVTRSDSANTDEAGWGDAKSSQPVNFSIESEIAQNYTTPEPVSTASEIASVWDVKVEASREQSHPLEGSSQASTYSFERASTPATTLVAESRRGSSIIGPDINPEKLVMQAAFKDASSEHEGTDIEDSKAKDFMPNSKSIKKLNNSNYLDLPSNRLEASASVSHTESLNNDQGINPERLAMLAASENASFDDEDIEMQDALPEKVHRFGKNKKAGNMNYVELPFNRLEKLHGKKSGNAVQEAEDMG